MSDEIQKTVTPSVGVKETENTGNSVKNSTANSGDTGDSIQSLKFRLAKALEQRDEGRKTLDERNQADEDARLLKMEEEGKFKETISDLKSQLATAKKRADAYDQYEKKQRADIMEQLSESDREIAASIAGLEGLQKFFTRTVESQRTRVPTQSGTPSNKTVLDKPLSSMTDNEKKQNWAGILDSYIK